MQRFSKGLERDCFLDIYCIFKEEDIFVTGEIAQGKMITEYPYENPLLILMSHPHLFKILIALVFFLQTD